MESVTEVNQYHQFCGMTGSSAGRESYDYSITNNPVRDGSETRDVRFRLRYYWDRYCMGCMYRYCPRRLDLMSKQ